MRNATLLFLVGALVITVAACADDAYISGGGGIYVWNTSTSTVTQLPGSPTGLDSLIFDTSGNIVFSQISTGKIGIYNTTTHTNTFFSPTGAGVADMALDPGGASVLVSNAFSNFIWRINLTTGAVMNTFIVGTRPDGLAYDASGNLFAVLGTDEIAQLNPNTGAIIKTFFEPAGCTTADALTFNPTTGKLYMSCDGGGFATFDTALTSATFTPLNLLPNGPDGIASLGNNLYFVNRGVGGVQYNLTTGVITGVSSPISGADDIAPLSGLGSNPTVPEPGSLVLLGTGLAGLVGVIRRRKL